MKREIKFRAWDNDRRLFYPFDILDGAPLVVVLGAPVMQSTGLKDKNGNEIWEGDIVKRSTLNHEWDDDNSQVPKYIEQVSFIEYRGNGFWVAAEDFGWEGENLWTWNLMEVIGNIYENPELLTPLP